MGHEEELRLHPKPVDFRAGVRYCLACAGGGLLLAATGHEVMVLSGLMIAGTFGAVAGLCALSPRPGRVFLDLRPGVLHEQSVYSARTWRWRDFEGFETVSDEDGEGVAFRYSDAYAGPRPRALFGIKHRLDGRLHDTYGMTARDLADLLNGWRTRHTPEAAVGSDRGADLLSS